MRFLSFRVKMFTCNICKITFTVKRNLTRHVKLHGGSKETFKCTDCEKTFSRRDNLNFHKEHHHRINGDNKMFKRGTCDKGFTVKSNMKRHMLTCKNQQQQTPAQSSTIAKPSIIEAGNESAVDAFYNEQEMNLPRLIDDAEFEFNIDSIPTIRSRQCYYCKKVFNRVDNCIYHQKHCRKRKYPNTHSSSKRKKTQVGQGSQNFPQLISSALEGSVKTYRKVFDYDESAIGNMIELEKMIKDFIHLITTESQQQDIKCFFSLNLSFHQANDESNVTDPAVTLRSNVFIVQPTATDAGEKVDAAMEEIKQLIDDFEKNGSGWVLHQLHYLDLGKVF